MKSVLNWEGRWMRQQEENTREWFGFLAQGRIG
jgi:hypothetical protein